MQGGGTLLETYVNNEFVRIRESVSRKLEITELVKRHGKKPILLEDLGGKRTPCTVPETSLSSMNNTVLIVLRF